MSSPTPLPTTESSKLSPDIRVYLIEDEALLRESLSAMLNSEPGITLCGSCGNAETGIEELDHTLVDVVLMDLRLPDLSGIEASRILKAKNPQLIIVALTSYSDEYLEEFFEAGGNGYFTKSCSHEELVAGIRSACLGSTPIEYALATRMIHQLAEHRRTAEQPVLSERQLAILRMTSQGLSPNQIADQMGVSERTVYRQKREICDRLGVANIGLAVSRALRLKLISLD